MSERKTRGKEESSGKMGTVEGKKQESAGHCWRQPMICFWSEVPQKPAWRTSPPGKGGKGTFYLYFQDKGAVMQALLAG